MRRAVRPRDQRPVCAPFPNLVRNGATSVSGKSVRQSMTLPVKVAKQVRTIAKNRRLGANRFLVELVEAGREARKHR